MGFNSGFKGLISSHGQVTRGVVFQPEVWARGLQILAAKYQHVTKYYT